MAFESFTDEKIQELLAMSKRVTNPGSRPKHRDGHEQFNYTVRADADPDYSFTLYTRQNKRPGMEDDIASLTRLLSPRSAMHRDFAV